MSKKKTFNKGDVIMRKTLSLILAVLMIVATMPMALAADPIQLSVANITVWPTITQTKDIYYGQNIGDAITLSGGEVQYNGEVIQGEFVYTDTVTPGYNTVFLPYTFVPSSADYIGFTTDEMDIGMNYYDNYEGCCYNVKRTEPTIAQKPVASDVVSGAKLSTSKFSGGEVLNPYTGEVLEGKWAWVKTSTKITVSGYQKAKFTSSPNGFYITDVDIYVCIEGDTPPTEEVEVKDTEVSVLPTIDSLTYDGVTTIGDLVLNGGVAVEKGTNTVVDGTFAITKNLTSVLSAGTRNITVTFTPNDITKYYGCEATTTVTVEKALPAWTEGERVVTYPYGSTPFGQYGDRIEQLDARYLNCYNSEYNPYNYTFMLFDENGEALNFGYYHKPDVGTYNYFVTVDAAWSVDALKDWDTTVLLPITIIIEPEECTINEVTYDFRKGEIKCDIGNIYLNGTVDLTVDGTAINGVKVTNGKFTASWLPADKTVNKDYAIKVVYNPAEDDNAVVAEAYEGTITYKANRTLTFKHAQISATNQHNSLYKPGETYLVAGEEVELYAGLPDFLYWTITDANGNPVELEITKNSIESRSFTFIMPDCDLIINASFQYQIDNPELDNPDNSGDDDTTGGIGDIDSIDGAFDWIMNLLNKIKAFFARIIEFFQGIGDMT